MLRYIMPAFLAAALLGCQISGPSDQPLSKGPSDALQPQLAAFAARAEYPTTQEASKDLSAAAIVDRTAKTITIRNFSDKNLRDANVWIDGSYVRHVDSIPAHGTVVLGWGQFYDRTGLSLENQMPSVTRVQVQTSDGLYTLQGPQYNR